MRPLRVLGLAEIEPQGTGQNLVCEDPTTGEQFSIPCDDRLRAGARGDLSRFGQLEIEMESQLRPKEIQARIRAGATVEQVAALAGTSSSRVERFAYPVLLERASVAERAVKARPAIDGITAGTSVAETVAATLSARGHDGDVTWDAFKDDEGWVLALSWSAGRSENRAHWLFHPGPGGGTLSARDEAAAEIVDPALRILRPLRPVGPGAATLDPTLPTERPRITEPGRSGHPAGTKLPAAAVSTVSAAPLSTPTRSSGPGRGGAATRSTRFGAPLQPQNLSSPNLTSDSPYSGGGHTVIDGSTVRDGNAERIVEDTVTDERAGVNPLSARAQVSRTGTESASRSLPAPRSTRAAQPTGDPTPGTEAHAATAAPRPAATKAARRGQRPAMPSWEDVLLGTKSSGR